VDDLVDAYEAAIARIDQLSGQVFNIGGGSSNTISIWTETRPLLAELLGHEIDVRWADWRPGDQRVCVMDIRKVCAMLNWTPKVGLLDGARRLVEWIVANRALFS
jgi:CDP-paratose 2-epimerase